MFRRNDYIRAKEVRLIGPEGEPLGVVTLQDALLRAKELNVDLIEVAANTQPPVCRIIEWSKFKYEYQKKQKVSKKNTGSELKEMWFKPLTDVGDLDHKLKKVREFLAEKHKVKITVKPGSNRRLDKSYYFDQINKVLEILNEETVVEAIPKAEGRNVYAIIRSKK